MFLKQYNYKPRSNSQGSSNAEASSAVDNTPAAPAADNTTPGAAGRRRSSAAGQFAGLTAHKRTSQDASVDMKKASFADQKPGGTGVLGSMWQSFTKGT